MFQWTILSFTKYTCRDCNQKIKSRIHERKKFYTFWWNEKEEKLLCCRWNTMWSPEALSPVGHRTYIGIVGAPSLPTAIIGAPSLPTAIVGAPSSHSHHRSSISSNGHSRSSISSHGHHRHLFPRPSSSSLPMASSEHHLVPLSLSFCFQVTKATEASSDSSGPSRGCHGPSHFKPGTVQAPSRKARFFAGHEFLGPIPPRTKPLRARPADHYPV